MPSSKLKNKPKHSSQASQIETFSFEAIGTFWQIDIVDSVNLSDQSLLKSEVKSIIDEFDKLLSRFRDDSLVSAMSKKAGYYELPNYIMPMLKLYGELHELSDGLFTPLIGQMLSQAGYDSSYSFEAKDLEKLPTLQEVFELKDNGIDMKQPFLLDFGAIGKGLLVDLVAQVIESFGIKSFLINAGGDMLVKNKASKPLRVGLEHPDHSDEAVGIAKLHNVSLCGSAGNRRKWLNYSHIMNPKMMSSEDSLKAVWVTAKTTMLADALTTALYFVTPNKLKQHYDFEYFMVKDDYSLEVSEAFPGEYFTN
jgi:thiamine biosynthesis lipoprotein